MALQAERLFSDYTHPTAATREDRRVVAVAQRAVRLQTRIVMLQQLQCVRAEHVQVRVAVHAIHVVADLLQDQEVAVAAVVHAEVPPAVDHAQHDVAERDHAVGVEAVQHERVLDAGRVVAVAHDDEARVLVARVERHVRTHLRVAVDHVERSARLRREHVQLVSASRKPVFNQSEH